MNTLDPNYTYVVLIAVPNYSEGNPKTNLPAASNNIADFRQSLIEDQEFNDSKIKPFHEGSKSNVLSYINSIIRKNDCKNIIIYYAGHGIPDDDGNTYLSFSDMKVDEYFNGLEINELSNIINKVNPNINVILLLDCCFSERSLKGIDLRYFFALAAASINQTANYPVGANYSSFYAAIRNVRKNGIDSPNSFISFNDLYSELKSHLNNQDTQQALKGDVGAFAFFKNRYTIPVTIPVHNEIKPILNALFDILSNENYLPSDDQLELNKFRSYDQKRYYNKLRANIFKYLPYPLGLLLKGHTVSSSEIDRASKIKEFFDTTIKFLAIILLSQLQKECESGKYKDKYGEIIQSMTNFPAHDPVYYIRLIIDINKFFQINNITPFLENLDIDKLTSYFQENNPLSNKNLADFTPEDTLQYEKLLWGFITDLHHLTKYTLVSVCSIGLNNKSFDKISYTHNGSIFYGDHENNYDFILAFTGTDFCTNSHTVLLVKDIKKNNTEYVNSWPFVIDKNCFDSTKGSTPKIYLMTQKAIGNGYYSYLSVERDKKEEIEIYTEIDPAIDTVERQFTKFREIWQA